MIDQSDKPTCFWRIYGKKSRDASKWFQVWTCFFSCDSPVGGLCPSTGFVPQAWIHHKAARSLLPMRLTVSICFNHFDIRSARQSTNLGNDPQCQWLTIIVQQSYRVEDLLRNYPWFSDVFQQLGWFFSPTIYITFPYNSTTLNRTRCRGACEWRRMMWIPWVPRQEITMAWVICV